MSFIFRSIVSLGLLWVAPHAGAAALEEGDCPSAAALLAADEGLAEARARTCQQAAPDDPQRMLTLSRILGWQDRHGEALAWVEAAIAISPADLDLAAWRLRLLGWLDRHEEARVYLEGVVADEEAGDRAEVEAHQELARVRADLALWRGDLDEAELAYASYLERWPDDTDATRSLALLRLERGELDLALPSLQTLCEGGDPRACDALQTPAKRGVRLLLQAGPITSSTQGSGWRARIGADGPLSERLHLRGGFELQERAYGGDRLRDPIFDAGLHWRIGDRFSLDGGAGFSIAPSFSPAWNAHVEGGWELGAGFSVHARYWRIQFPAAGVDVLSPAVAYATDRFWASLRLWRSFDSEGEGLALLGRLGVQLVSNLELSLGLGGGDEADYLILGDVAVGAERHLVGLAGLAWNPSEAYQLRVDYVGRREQSGDDSLLRHELLFGVARQF